MNTEQIAVALAVDVAMLTTAAALLVRGRWRLCWGFACYAVAVISHNLSLVLWPERFYKPWFWMLASGVFEALRMWIALEIAWRVFRKVRDGRVTLLVLGGIAVFTTAARLEGTGWGLFASDTWHAWISNGPLLIMAATLLIARWDRLRLHPFHGALLVSFAVYQAVFQLLIRLYVYPTEPFVWKLRALEPFVFLALICSWAYAAWRPASRLSSSGPDSTADLAREGNAQSGPTNESDRMFQRWGFWPALRSSIEA